jgi:Tfp pilus assembly protein PilV
MKTMKILKLNNQSGFTLLEALIGSFILTVGILSVYAMLVSGVRNNSHARAVTEATTLAADRLEFLNSLLYTNAYLNNGTRSAVKDNYTVTWTVVTTGNIKTITVNVTGDRLGRNGVRDNVALASVRGRDL